MIERTGSRQDFQEVRDRAIKNNEDGIIGALDIDFDEDGYPEIFANSYVVFEPEQIHILGSKQDIEGFKDFVQGKQFQKLTEEEKAKTIEQVTKEHRSITALKDLSAKLAHRIGGKIKFENRTDVDWKGYNQGNTSVLNEAYMTPDTPFHEILAHPIIRAIKYINPDNQKTNEFLKRFKLNNSEFIDESDTGEGYFRDNKRISEEEFNEAVNEYSKVAPLYKSLLKELETGRGKEVFDRIKRDYQYKLQVPNKYQTEFADYYIDNGKYYIYYPGEGDIQEISKQEYEKNIPNNIKYTLEEQQEEAIVTLLGELAAGKLEEKENATLRKKLLEFWKQISDFVKSLLRQDGIKIDELPIS